MKNTNARLVLLLSVFVFVGVPIQKVWGSNDGPEIRPSHLLNVELADVLAEKQIVLSAFGQSARASLGVGRGFETRIDLAGITVPRVGTSSYNISATGKYQILSSNFFGIGVMASLGSQLISGGAASSSATFRVPLTVRLLPFLLTLIPRLTQPFISSPQTTTGVDFGVAFPVVSCMDLTGEALVGTTSGITTVGYNIGVVFKPWRNVTLPLVFVSDSGQGSGPSVGIVQFFAHLGLEI